MSPTKMRIAIFSTMPPKAYSGGRYATVMIAKALSLGGHETHIITDHKPIFYDDLAGSPAPENMVLHVAKKFGANLPEGPFDFVLFVPSLCITDNFLLETELFALRRGAYLAFLNFESGNWFNSLSPFPRDLKTWDVWKDVCSRCSLILSIAKEGSAWARKFYTECPDTTRFDWCYPAINTGVADKVHGVTREKRIVFFARFSWSDHKGVKEVEKVFCEAMRGYTLVFLVGGGDMKSEAQRKLEKRAKAFGVRIEYLHRVSDRDKFREIKRAALMLFPSYFEGFGYPPVEAQYCNTPCVAFDLPVLREHSGDGLIYARHGDWDDFRKKVETVLSSPQEHDHLREHIRSVASPDAMADRLNAVLLPFLLDKKPSAWFVDGASRPPLDPNVKVAVSVPKLTGPTWTLGPLQKQFQLDGWYVAPSSRLVVVTVNGEPFPVEQVPRPDVKASNPDAAVAQGFRFVANRESLRASNQINVEIGGAVCWAVNLLVPPPAVSAPESGLRATFRRVAAWFEPGSPLSPG